eukprot:1159695-Pelagomonas_calceolata.AAC.4
MQKGSDCGPRTTLDHAWGTCKKEAIDEEKVKHIRKGERGKRVGACERPGHRAGHPLKRVVHTLAQTISIHTQTRGECEKEQVHVKCRDTQQKTKGILLPVRCTSSLPGHPAASACSLPVHILSTRASCCQCMCTATADSRKPIEDSAYTCVQATNAVACPPPLQDRGNMQGKNVVRTLQPAQPGTGMGARSQQAEAAALRQQLHALKTTAFAGLSPNHNQPAPHAGASHAATGSADAKNTHVTVGKPHGVAGEHDTGGRGGKAAADAVGGEGTDASAGAAGVAAADVQPRSDQYGGAGSRRHLQQLDQDRQQQQQQQQQQHWVQDASTSTLLFPPPQPDSPSGSRMAEALPSNAGGVCKM